MFIKGSGIQSVTINDSWRVSSTISTNKILSVRILLYSTKANGFALIASSVNVPRIYKPSSVVTLLQATLTWP